MAKESTMFLGTPLKTPQTVLPERFLAVFMEGSSVHVVRRSSVHVVKRSSVHVVFWCFVQNSWYLQQIGLVICARAD